MGARDVYAPDFPTDLIVTNADGTDTRLAAYVPHNLDAAAPSRVREARKTVAPARDEYQGLGYDGADELRIGSAFDMAAKNRGVIGPGTGTVGPQGWPVTGGTLNGKDGGVVLPHLDLMQQTPRGVVEPYRVTQDELAEIPPIYVGSPT